MLGRRLQIIHERWAIRSLIALSVSTLIGLALAYAAIRFWSLDWRLVEKLLYYQNADLPVNMPVKDPRILYRLRPDTDYGDGYVHINRLGFRGREYDAKKPEGVFRILCLGGSNVYGLGLGDDGTWPAQLEKMMNLRFKGRFEAWNCGVCAHTVSQSVAIGLEAADRYDPDLVILALSNRGAPPFLWGSPIKDYFRDNPEFWDLAFNKNYLGRRQNEWLRASPAVRFLLGSVMWMKRNGWRDNMAHEENNYKVTHEFFNAMKKRGIRAAGFLYPGLRSEDFREFFDKPRAPFLALDGAGLPNEYLNIHPPHYVMTWYGDEIANWLAQNGLLGPAPEKRLQSDSPLPRSAYEGFGLDGEVRIEDATTLLPGGRFMMGCSPGDCECCYDESPRHTVGLDPFRIDRTEVANGQYRLCVEAGACSEPDWPDWYREKPGNHPVVGVSHKQAESYCHWKGGRLPSEAQWEFAARAGSPALRHAPIGEIAWYDENSGRSTQPVGQKRPNAWGLYDMYGNAWEWVADQYDPQYFDRSPARNPVDSNGAPEFIRRGGGWFTHELYVRATYRSSRFAESSSSKDLGFRCVTNADSTK